MQSQDLRPRCLHGADREAGYRKHIFPQDTLFSLSSHFNFIPLVREIMERERYSRHCLCNSQAQGKKCPGVITDLHLLFFSCIQCLFKNVPEGRYLDYDTVNASQTMENSEKALDWVFGSRVPFLIMPTRLCELGRMGALSGPGFPTWKMWCIDWRSLSAPDRWVIDVTLSLNSPSSFCLTVCILLCMCK